VGQREVHRVDAAVVGLEIDDAVRLAHARLAHRAQFALHRIDEGREDIEHQRAAGGQRLGDGGIDDRVDHDRARIVAQARFADAFDRIAGFFRIVDERNPVGDEGETGELREQAMPNGFNGDTGSIRDIEHRPDTRHCLHPVC